ncbi:MAG: GGDEF domain-containing protein, partial [Pseudomonadota bacterium]
RFGGEEFCIARLGTTPQETLRLAEDIRSVVEQRPIYLPNGARIDLTVSIGVAMAVPDRAASVDKLLDCADRALYASKAAGRNCVRFHRAAA